MKNLMKLMAGIAACLLVLLILAPLCQAGDVVTRRADAWTNATGTNITAGLWESWEVKKIEFYGLNPTNTAIAITVRYAVGGYTQTVSTVTGDANGMGSYTSEFPVVTGDVLVYTPGAASTGKVVTTYARHNP